MSGWAHLTVFFWGCYLLMNRITAIIMRTETSLIIEDTTWCVLLLGEMVYYVSYIVFNNLLHLMCKDMFACHIFYLELPCPPEKEIKNKVSTRSILCYLWETMKTHFKFLPSIPDIFLNFVSFLKWLNWSFEWRCTFIHAWLHIPTYIQQYVHLTCSLN